MAKADVRLLSPLLVTASIACTAARRTRSSSWSNTSISAIIASLLPVGTTLAKTSTAACLAKCCWCVNNLQTRSITSAPPSCATLHRLSMATERRESSQSAKHSLRAEMATGSFLGAASASSSSMCDCLVCLISCTISSRRSGLSLWLQRALFAASLTLSRSTPSYLLRHTIKAVMPWTSSSCSISANTCTIPRPPPAHKSQRSPVLNANAEVLPRHTFAKDLNTFAVGPKP
mmetsp:Transcript_86964/g.154020  ORF Transcript_86964/g.154020 Transcript_86964/m.154020 type:complete len:232 (+) Transcript_86964:396-1091(+)